MSEVVKEPTAEEWAYMTGYAGMLATEEWLAEEITKPDYDGRLDKHISDSVIAIVNSKEK